MKLPLAIAVVGACTIAGSVAATQYLAHAFRYAPALGKPLIAVGGIGVYRPHDWCAWGRSHVGDSSPHVRSFAIGLGLSGPLVGSILARHLLWRHRLRMRVRRRAAQRRAARAALRKRFLP